MEVYWKPFYVQDHHDQGVFPDAEMVVDGIVAADGKAALSDPQGPVISDERLDGSAVPGPRSVFSLAPAKWRSLS